MSTNKDEKNRRMGLQIAYHLIEGSETAQDDRLAIAQRLTRAEQLNVPVTVRDADLKEFESRVKNNVFTMLLACCLETLTDGFGFGKDQMDTFTEAVSEKVDTIYGGWLDFDDLVLYLKDEYGFDLNEWIGKSQEMLDRIEEKIDKRTEFVGEKRVYQRR